MSHHIKQEIAELNILCGSNLKTIRKLNKYTQKDIADMLTLTFQQIQKYEKGDNRISAASLFYLLRILNVDISVFFSSLGDKKSQSEGFTAEDIQLFHLIRNTKNKKTKKALINVIKAL
jgi:transcriptional regulator with XRE-family HTH domain